MQNPELRLSDLFLEFIKSQQRLELVRSVLAEIPIFDPYRLYLFLLNYSQTPPISQPKDKISPYDISQFLLDNGISCNSDELFMLISFYNLENNGKGLTYENFLKLVLPYDSALYKIALIRASNGYFNSEEIPHEIKYGLLRIINTELAMNKKAEPLKKALIESIERNETNIVEMFRCLDYKNEGFITTEGIMKFLEKYNHLVEKKAAELVIKRFDKDRDQRISYSEFVDSILPYESLISYKDEKYEIKSIIKSRRSLSTSETKKSLKFTSPIKASPKITKIISPEIHNSIASSPIASKRKVRFATPLKSSYKTPEKYTPQTEASTSKKSLVSPIKSIMRSSSKSTQISPSKTIEKLNESPENYRKKLKKTIQNYIWLERRLEKAKVELALMPDFTYQNAFKLLDKNEKGYANFDDFMEYIADNEIKGNLKSVKEFYAKNMKNELGKMRLAKFIEILSPNQTEYANLMLNRIMYLQKNDTENKMSIKAKVRMNYVFEIIFANEEEYEKFKLKENIEDFNELFDIFDIKKMGCITNFTVFFQINDMKSYANFVIKMEFVVQKLILKEL